MKAILEGLKKYINRIPIAGPLVGAVYAKILTKRFNGSEDYWIARYKRGGNSGAGSYDRLAEFKAEVLNRFVIEQEIESIIEYGCGDGNQLKLARYKKYLGFDISPEAVAKCQKTFYQDPAKSFRLMAEYKQEAADLTISLDVLYHLVEDHVFENYLHRLFDSSIRFVIIYSSNKDAQDRIQPPHVKHRKFTEWINQNIRGWRLDQNIPNKHPFRRKNKEGSFADFFIYQKIN
jgi:SAM-dependent methyltransferase